MHGLALEYIIKFKNVEIKYQPLILKTNFGKKMCTMCIFVCFST